MDPNTCFVYRDGVRIAHGPEGSKRLRVESESRIELECRSDGSVIGEAADVLVR